ncbi:hypothetical protein GZ201_05655, partial [Dermatophilus congolensis]|nr:hypothetical protein [Dermatophilus congolensis]MBO3145204.1 hypothetical protein [Dermatophilus congolensis]MBO3147461.1 hypothetical protein [Dermatophilus congolensis]
MMGLSLGRSGVAGASLGSVIPAELVPDADVLAQLESFAVDLASGAGRLVVTERPEGMEVDTKTTETDVVTEMDRRAQEYLVGR